MQLFRALTVTCSSITNRGDGGSITGNDNGPARSQAHDDVACVRKATAVTVFTMAGVARRSSRTAPNGQWPALNYAHKLVSDTAVDIAMLLRDVMMPLPMRDGWGPEMEWPYPGVEYTARAFRAACERLGVAQSMGRPGSALDNAVIESWHSTLEFELRSLREFATRAQALPTVAAWIEDYNTVRRHSALGMRSPAAYEQSLKGKDTP